jgi:cobalamin biosynthesis protein CobD/CbiB
MIQLPERRAWRKAIKGKLIGGGIAALVVVVLIIVVAFLNSQLLIDVILIVTALVSMLAFALLGYAALQVVALVKEVRGEVHTLIGTAKETMAEVQGTAKFVNSAVVSPVAQVAGWANATRATIKSFTEPLYKRGE